MNIYPLLKPLLFQLDAEQAHDLTLHSLKRAEKLGLLALAAGRLPEQHPWNGFGRLQQSFVGGAVEFIDGGGLHKVLSAS